MTKRTATKKSAATLLQIEGLQIAVVNKRVRNINLRMRNDGTIVVSAPYRTPLAKIEEVVRDRIGWLRTAQARVLSQASLQDKTCNEGSVVSIWGIPYRCHIVPAERASARSCSFSLEDGLLVAHTPPCRMGTDDETSARRAKDLEAWLRAELMSRIEALRPQYEGLVGVQCANIRIRSMTSRWGVCNVSSKVITLNLNLVHFDDECLAYVLCHELCHLHEPSHNARFHALMDRYYPDWRRVRALLNGRL